MSYNILFTTSAILTIITLFLFIVFLIKLYYCSFKSLYNLYLSLAVCIAICLFPAVFIGKFFTNFINYTLIPFVITYHIFITLIVFGIVLTFLSVLLIIHEKFIPYLKKFKFISNNFGDFYLLPDNLNIKFCDLHKNPKTIKYLSYISYILSSLILLSFFQSYFLSLSSSNSEKEIILNDFKVYSNLFIATVIPLVFSAFKSSKEKA